MRDSEEMDAYIAERERERVREQIAATEERLSRETRKGRREALERRLHDLEQILALLKKREAERDKNVFTDAIGALQALTEEEPELKRGAGKEEEGEEEEREEEDAWDAWEEECAEFTPEESQDEHYDYEADLMPLGGFQTSKRLYEALREYQREGVRWILELLTRNCGGLLADEPGLGKTVQVIAAMATMFLSERLEAALIVCPATLQAQWIAMFHAWWPPARVCLMGGGRDEKERKGGTQQTVIVVSYEYLTKHLSEVQNLFRRLCGRRTIPYAVFDEVHFVKNMETGRSRRLRTLPIDVRLGLSASPIQNSLVDVFSILDFLQPGLLGSREDFDATYAHPIRLGSLRSAQYDEIRLAIIRSKDLIKLVQPYLLRRQKKEVERSLPPKTEKIVLLRLSERQERDYCEILADSSVEKLRHSNRRSNRSFPLLMTSLIRLQHVCDHPLILLQQRGEKRTSPSRGFVQSHLIRNLDVDHERLAILSAERREKGEKRAQRTINNVRDCPSFDPHDSSKLTFLLAKLSTLEEKALVFCQGRMMLDVIERAFNDSDLRGRYLRLDGTTTLSSRQEIVQTFNTDELYRVLLLTTRVGGLGLNLTSANHVFLMNPHWNPTVDEQSLDRCWRISQTRPVHVYRLLTAGTVEEKIHHRQLFKQALADRVLHAGQPLLLDHFDDSTLQQLFTYDPPTQDLVIHVREHRPGPGRPEEKAAASSPLEFLSPRLADHVTLPSGKRRISPRDYERWHVSDSPAYHSCMRALVAHIFGPTENQQKQERNEQKEKEKEKEAPPVIPLFDLLDLDGAGDSPRPPCDDEARLGSVRALLEAACTTRANIPAPTAMERILGSLTCEDDRERLRGAALDPSDGSLSRAVTRLVLAAMRGPRPHGR
ncbi:DNA repair and recombination protein Rhp26p [Giardia muris]|uniref:DNA repair and recombination protein Rhp26p n=1 Tax=Giardia muris TaxID=5742 RepID=A0A4Z1T134_GIAMU|nr:DNA repair and recombination protein Rhp26p [Giardia muris]|eukprot:TNJ27613.1 DNA repair and recombination protein Rhp26p [Giardia muris]